MEWRNKINALIRQTEINLSLVDGRAISSSLSTDIPNNTAPPSPSLDDTSINANGSNESIQSPSPPPPDTSTKRTIMYGGGSNGTISPERRTTQFSPSSLSLFGNLASPLMMRDSGYLDIPKDRLEAKERPLFLDGNSNNDVAVELKLLKQQFLLFKDSSEKTIQVFFQ